MNIQGRYKNKTVYTTKFLNCVARHIVYLLNLIPINIYMIRRRHRTVNVKLIKTTNMKNLLVISVLVFFLAFCKKENTTSLESEYQAIYGTWNLKSVSYDSAGVRITKTLPYNKLVVDDNMEYQIYSGLPDPIENGSVSIISQSEKKLVLFFSARYSSSSSYVGSHIFGITNVQVVSVSSDDMTIKTINAAYDIYSDQEIIFQR
jgi:hypothetical protein